MNQTKDTTTTERTYELSQDEVKRITRRFIGPGGSDEEIADFLLILKAIAYAPTKAQADDIVFYAEDAAVSYSYAASQTVKKMVDERYQAIQEAA